MIVNKQLMSDLKFFEKWYWSKPDEPLKRIDEWHPFWTKYGREYRRGQKIWGWQAHLRRSHKDQRFKRYPSVEMYGEEGNRDSHCNGVWHRYYWPGGRGSRRGGHDYKLCNCSGGLYKSRGHMVRVP